MFLLLFYTIRICLSGVYIIGQEKWQSLIVITFYDIWKMSKSMSIKKKPYVWFQWLEIKPM